MRSLQISSGWRRRLRRWNRSGSPGTECHYHAVTFSWLAFKPLKNITGCSFNELVRRYLGKDCYCGMTLREAETLPIAWLEPNPSPPALSDTVPLNENDRIARWRFRRRSVRWSSG